MDEQYLRSVAFTIAYELLRYADFSLVCEDVDLEDATKEQLLFVHDLITKAGVVLSD